VNALDPGFRRALEAAGLRPLDVALADWGLRHGGDAAGALGLALASHAVAQGHTCLQLDDAAPRPHDGEPLMRPDRLRDGLADSALVAAPDSAEVRPLVLAGDRLYLQRYWDYEQRLAARLQALLAAPPEPVDTDPLGPDGGLFAWDWTGAGETNWQAVAAFVAARHRFAVISGGPGTGKTYTIVRLILRQLEAALAAGTAPPVFRLAAPTGKAAARMMASVRAGLEQLRPRTAVAPYLPGEATTLHRLLRLRPGSTQPGHDAQQPIPADVVIVDEASMVDLPLMAKLAEAIPPRGRLILLGDRYQLASVDSGAVLADLCTLAGVNAFSPDQRSAAGPLLGATAEATEPGPLGDHVVTLQTSHRFQADSAIGLLAAAINAGDPAGVETALSAEATEIRATFDAQRTKELIEALAEVYAGLHDAGDAEAALDVLESVRLLTATRVGPLGSDTLNRRIAESLAARHGFDPAEAWYHGRPIMVVRNEPRAGLYNGDVGVIRHDDAGHAQAWFRTEAGLRTFQPSMLPPHETVYAMTIHKAQGSEFDTVYLLLPPTPAPVLSRELLYTAVTRARTHLHAHGPLETWQAAARHSVERHSGLAARLMNSKEREALQVKSANPG